MQVNLHKLAEAMSGKVLKLFEGKTDTAKIKRDVWMVK